MLLRALLLVIGALNFVSGTALAVDRGQFENVPDDIRAWFKGVRSPAGVPCCDISDGHRTEYDVRSGAYWVPINGLWWQVPEKAIVRNAGNPRTRHRLEYAVYQKLHHRTHKIKFP